MTIKKNGNGTYIVSKWFWIGWTLLTVLISFTTSYALTQYRVNQNRANIEAMATDIKEINKDIGDIKGDIKCVKYALGIKD